MAKRMELQDLNIYYGDFLAVQGVDMVIEPRAVTAFIGPSGCGKSTVLRSLDRMLELTPGGRVEGKVLLDGQDIYAPNVDPVRVRQQVGMVFQQPNPFPTMSIRDNVLAGIQLNARKMPKAHNAAPTSGMRLRTASTRPATAFRAASSSGCASPARSRSSLRCC